MKTARRNRLKRWGDRARGLPKTVWFIAAAVLVLLVVGRALLPNVIARTINRQLATMPELAGHVSDVDLHLWRGAYSLEEIVVNKQMGELQVPLLEARSIDFSIAWSQLWRGRLVSQILIVEPRLTYMSKLTDLAVDEEADRDWQEIVRELSAFEVTRFEIVDGEMRFVDRTTEPHVDLGLTNVHVLATGLTNRPAEDDEEFPARMEGSGRTVGAGHLSFFLAAEPLAEAPHFELTMEVEDVALNALNDLLRAYANVDVSAGTFHAYLEVAAKGGRFEGYMKPFFEDLDFENIADRNQGFAQRLWESLVEFTTSIVKNKPEDQVATRIPFEGGFEQTEVGVWATVVNLLRNGFVQALRQGFDGGVSAESAAAGDGAESDDAGRPSE